MKEAEGFPDYFEIPGFNRYAIKQDGTVINKQTNTVLQGGTNSDGYHNFRLTSDTGYVLTWGRHRLMGFVFKNPGRDIKGIVINHDNGVKGDDRLSNLEWATQQRNIEHAGAMGLSEKCQPISVRDLDTGIVNKYPSMIACAREMGVTKDAINWRIKAGEDRVFPDRKQYRAGHGDEPWLKPDERYLAINGTSKKILVRNVMTGEVITFDQMSQVAEAFNVSPSVITLWVDQPNHPVVTAMFQMKRATDTSPWREVKDPYLELEQFTHRRCVKVVHQKTGESTIYLSATQCAKAMQLLPTTLHERLRSKGLKFYSDGFSYCYYSDSVKQQ